MVCATGCPKSPNIILYYIILYYIILWLQYPCILQLALYILHYFMASIPLYFATCTVYIYNTPTYGCTSMLTFILNVLGEVLGIENLYCRPFYSAGSGPCARPRDFENRLLSDVLANFGRFLPPLILKQTLTALLPDGQRHSFETAPNRSSTSPRAFFDSGRARLRGLHSAAWNT